MAGGAGFRAIAEGGVAYRPRLGLDVLYIIAAGLHANEGCRLRADGRLVLGRRIADARQDEERKQNEPWHIEFGEGIAMAAAIRIDVRHSSQLASTCSTARWQNADN